MRRLVRKQTGGVHHIFGGGVPFVVMCFKTLMKKEKKRNDVFILERIFVDSLI